MSRGGEEGYVSCRGFDARSAGTECKAPQAEVVRMDGPCPQQEQHDGGQQAGDAAPQKHFSQQAASAASGSRNARTASRAAKRRAGRRAIGG
jgi:hypothetical protein